MGQRRVIEAELLLLGKVRTPVLQVVMEKGELTRLVDLGLLCRYLVIRLYK
jgi:hypothetical protein